jgi:hypothetical protein
MKLTESMLRKIIREEARRIVESVDSWKDPVMKTHTSRDYQADLNTQFAGVDSEMERLGRMSDMGERSAEIARIRSMISELEGMGRHALAKALRMGLAGRGY